ncbi:hypothetical protein B0H13DRAFT_2305820 [Mycena leptocephala]|nr:hypothetical protein B0H13DRAFT_2305820 [Mycena leptocephala]
MSVLVDGVRTSAVTVSALLPQTVLSSHFISSYLCQCNPSYFTLAVDCASLASSALVAPTSSSSLLHPMLDSSFVALPARFDYPMFNGFPNAIPPASSVILGVVTPVLVHFPSHGMRRSLLIQVMRSRITVPTLLCYEICIKFL